jgi:hypothetical protein
VGRLSLAVCLLLVGCRFHFDPLGDPGSDAGSDARGVATGGGYTSGGNTYVKASNTDSFDDFGFHVAISADGLTLAASSEQEASAATGIDGNQADNSLPSAGAVYVFSRNGATVVQQAYLKASNTDSYDYFGWSLAVSGDGNTIAVGAHGESSAATGIDGNQSDNTATSSGAVYVFTRSGATWAQQAYVKASNTGANDQFGDAVALSADGNTLAVGAAGEASAATGIDGNQADNSQSGRGAVYVFARTGTTWAQQAYVKASNPTLGTDGFGKAVALSIDGNTLAVGAPGENGSGAAYVYTRSGTTWAPQAFVKASNAGFGDGYGTALALSGDGSTLAVGALWEGSAATGIGGDQADNSARFAGAVYLVECAGTTWTQQLYIKASNAQTNDFFGDYVAMSSDGNWLAVGAAGESSGATGIAGNQADNSANGAGAVYVFARRDTGWAQDAYVKATNTGPMDNFGTVALSANADVLVVGAQTEDSSATGINGNQSDDSLNDAGAVYVYF